MLPILPNQLALAIRIVPIKFANAAPFLSNAKHLLFTRRDHLLQPIRQPAQSLVILFLGQA